MAPAPPCLGDVALTVSSGATPAFNWAPACALGSLVVLDAAQSVYWNIQAPVGRNELRPSISYGRVPDGAVQEGPLIALEPGFGYVVRVFRLERDDENQITSVVAGESNFRH
jgi:hypothetical protein